MSDHSVKHAAPLVALFKDCAMFNHIGTQLYCLELKLKKQLINQVFVQYQSNCEYSLVCELSSAHGY